jgi:hypothetical protein
VINGESSVVCSIANFSSLSPQGIGIYKENKRMHSSVDFLTLQRTLIITYDSKLACRPVPFESLFDVPSFSNAAAVIMGITYGINIADKEDRYIATAEKALEGMGQAASPGAFLVDLLPCRTLSSLSF